MQLVITMITPDRKIVGYDYETSRPFNWSEATFIKHYEQGCKFWQEMRVLNQNEIPSYADLSTVQWDNRYGCYRFLVPANSKQIYDARRQYVFLHETPYGTQYFCKRGVESSYIGDAKVFDETDVYKQANYMKSHPMYRTQGWKFIPIN